jgi:hypothetical protein
MILTFSGLHFFIFYDHLEFLSEASQTPTGQKIVISHLCALARLQFSCNYNSILFMLFLHIHLQVYMSCRLYQSVERLTPEGNQIYIVTLCAARLTQASFLQKNQTLQNGFLISVTLRWHRASVACKNQSF